MENYTVDTNNRLETQKFDARDVFLHGLLCQSLVGSHVTTQRSVAASSQSSLAILQITNRQCFGYFSKVSKKFKLFFFSSSIPYIFIVFSFSFFLLHKHSTVLGSNRNTSSKHRVNCGDIKLSIKKNDRLDSDEVQGSMLLLETLQRRFSDLLKQSSR